MGIQGDVPLVLAFVILAAYTYFSGLRAPALIALVKDVLIYITIAVAVVVIPTKLGGFGHIFAAVPPQKLLLAPAQYSAFATLALGSALALFMYPHSITAVLSSNSRAVIRRNAALLPAYTFVLGLIALLGYMALAARVNVAPPYGAQFAVPALFNAMFPSWFVGFAFAAIAIGALVPASIMSIAAANLFTRNIYREYLRSDVSARDEANMAKLVSLVVKAGALGFILLLPTQHAINLQLLGGVWIIQTLPAIVVGLYTRWFHRWALLLGWATGMVSGTLMAVSVGFGSTFTLHLGGSAIAGYSAFYALIVNLVVTVVATPILRAVGARDGADETRAADYTDIGPESGILPGGQGNLPRVA